MNNAIHKILPHKIAPDASAITGLSIWLCLSEMASKEVRLQNAKNARTSLLDTMRSAFSSSPMLS